VLGTQRRTSRSAAGPGDLPQASETTRRLKVSVIGTLPPTKGVSPYTRQLVSALAARDDLDVQVIAFKSIYPRWAYPGGNPKETSDEEPPAWLSQPSVRAMVSWWNPISWVRAGFAIDGDVVHAQWWTHVLSPMYLAMLATARLRGKRIVMTVHNVTPHESNAFTRFLARRVMRFGERFIVHSPQNRSSLSMMVRKSDGRTTVLPHGVLDAPRTGMTREDARRALNIAPNAKVVLAFGNIRPYKGADVLLRSFADVVRQDPDALLMIAGKPWWKFDPQPLIDELGIGANVRTHLDFVPSSDVEAFFVAADVVALPYTSFEAQSGVGALALPFGRALVVSDEGGLPELTDDPQTIVPAGDAHALTAALSRVLGDAELRQHLEAQSLEIAARLGWNEIASSTMDIYRSMIPADVAAAEPLAAPEPVAPAGARQL
jgi:glycosyltransferase involved in cell wall biosynthesis